MVGQAMTLSGCGRKQTIPLSPEELDDALEIADIMDGKLPHWQRQDRAGDADWADDSEKLTRLTASKLQTSDNEDKKYKQ